MKQHHKHIILNSSIYCFVSEFQPGVPWKGIPNIDPESDPYVTPGSVLGGTVTAPIVDTDHQLLRDNSTGLQDCNTYFIVARIGAMHNTGSP